MNKGREESKKEGKGRERRGTREVEMETEAEKEEEEEEEEEEVKSLMLHWTSYTQEQHICTYISTYLVVLM
jgi:hypothetical protein